jgi:hypothetical protein
MALSRPGMVVRRTVVSGDNSKTYRNGKRELNASSARFFGSGADDGIVSFADLHYMTTIEFRPDDVACDPAAAESVLTTSFQNFDFFGACNLVGTDPRQ